MERPLSRQRGILRASDGEFAQFISVMPRRVHQRDVLFCCSRHAAMT